MVLRIALGQSDFLRLRRDDAVYVDKTHFVSEVLTDLAQVLLFCRPRRFGKTLNMTTLRAFVERSDADVRPAFAGLAIEGAGDAVWRHFQGHPVIFLTFKDVKERHFGDAWKSIRRLIQAEAARLNRQHELALRPSLLDPTAEPGDMSYALTELTEAIHRVVGDPPILLIDEYDTPLHTAHVNGYFDEAIDFFRPLYGAALKDNAHMERAVLTGILRLAKESVFSGLNNVAVHSVLSDRYADAFGFTDAEVDRLSALAALSSEVREGLRRVYNGYRFGAFDIYNPWSVTSFLRSTTDELDPYWMNTADNTLIRELLVERGHAETTQIEVLLRGGSIEATIDEHVTLRDVGKRPEQLWTFLLMAGYLRVDSVRRHDAERVATLRVPNREVLESLRSLVRREVDARPGGGADIADALFRGDAEAFAALLQELLERVLSYHDLGGRKAERVYQAFICGLLVTLEPTHRAESNREAGFGRADVLVTPKRPGLPGVAMELKVATSDVEAALDAGLAQLRAKDYAAPLRAAGADPLRLVCAVFDGKHVAVKFELEPAPQPPP